MTVAQRHTAASLIAKSGQAVTLTRRASGAYDPATGSAAITTSTQTGKGVILPLVPYRKTIGNLRESDRNLLLSALDSNGTAMEAPDVDDTVTLDSGAVVTILSVDPLDPAGLAIYFDCVVRAAA